MVAAGKEGKVTGHSSVEVWEMGSRKETRNEGRTGTGWRSRKDSGKMRRKKK